MAIYMYFGMILFLILFICSWPYLVVGHIHEIPKLNFMIEVGETKRVQFQCTKDYMNTLHSSDATLFANVTAREGRTTLFEMPDCYDPVHQNDTVKYTGSSFKISYNNQELTVEGLKESPAVHELEVIYTSNNPSTSHHMDIDIHVTSKGERPVIFSVSEPKPVLEGGSVQLSCEVLGGKLHPYVAWFAPDGTLLQNRTCDPHLKMRHLTKGDTGDYTCVVTSYNGLGTAVSRTVHLIVESLPVAPEITDIEPGQDHVNVSVNVQQIDNIPENYTLFAEREKKKVNTTCRWGSEKQTFVSQCSLYGLDEDSVYKVCAILENNVGSSKCSNYWSVRTTPLTSEPPSTCILPVIPRFSDATVSGVIAGFVVVLLLCISMVLYLLYLLLKERRRTRRNANDDQRLDQGMPLCRRHENGGCEDNNVNNDSPRHENEGCEDNNVNNDRPGQYAAVEL